MSELINVNKLWRQDFTLLLLYITSGNFAAAVFSIALSFLVLKLTGSPGKMAITMGLNLLPNIIRPFSATFFDRVNFKIPVIVLNIIGGFLLIFLYFYLSKHSVSISVVYFVVFLNSLVVAIYDPALPKLIPFVISKKFITKAMGILTTSNSTTQMCGLLFGGILVSFFGEKQIILFYGISCILVTIFLFFVEMPKISVQERMLQNKFFYDFIEGIKVTLSKKNILFFCITAFLIDAVFAPLKVLFPLYMAKIGKGEIGFGLLMTFFTGGCILGGFLIAVFGSKIKDLNGVAVALLIFSSSFLGLLIFKSYNELLLFMLIIGVAVGMINTYIIVLIQKTIPFTFLSRAIGFCNTCANLGSPIVLFLLTGVIHKITLNEVFLCSLVLSVIFLFKWLFNIGVMNNYVKQPEKVAL